MDNINITIISTLYCASRGDVVTGIFTSQELAEASGSDKVEPVALNHIDGSPEPGEYAFLARGLWQTISSENGAITTEELKLPPVWGTNPQTAISGIFGKNFQRAGAKLTELRLFRIGQDYSDAPPENLVRKYPFCALIPDTEAMRLRRGFSAEQLSEDYLAIYFERLEAKKELSARFAAPALALLCDRMIELACEKALSKGKTSICGFYLTRERQQLEKRLCLRFTTRELEIVCHLWGLEENKAIGEAIDRGELPPDELSELDARVRKLIPAIIAR